MPRRSAGLLMYRRRDAAVEVFLVHPGGPLWAKKDTGVWSLPKGEYGAEEEPLAAARREFVEETGFAVDAQAFIDLGQVTQAGGKIVAAWGFEGDCDSALLVSNTCEIEWPPRSRQMLVIPEIDRGCWFVMDDARSSLKASQEPFLDRLLAALDTSS